MTLARCYSIMFSAAMALLGATQNVEAREDVVPGARYTSARGAALGDAYLPLGEDGVAALFYNPADFGKIKHATAEPIHIQIYGNTGYVSGFGTDFYKVASLSSYRPTLAKNPGVIQGMGGSVFPNFYMRDFGFGMLMQSQLGAKVNSDGSISYRSTYQVIPTFGFGYRLAEGIVRIGYSVQWVNEAVGSNTVPSGTDPLGYNQGLASGSGFSHTVGFALTLPVAYLPAINIVGRNIAGVHYNAFSAVPLARNSSGTPADDLMSIDASFSVSPKFTSGSGFNLVVEDRDLTSTSGISLLGRLALGAEFEIKNKIFLRGGWGGGYPSFGLGVRRMGSELSITRYTEELGSTYQALGDTRYLIEYQIRAF